MLSGLGYQAARWRGTSEDTKSMLASTSGLGHATSQHKPRYTIQLEMKFRRHATEEVT